MGHSPSAAPLAGPSVSVSVTAQAALQLLQLLYSLFPGGPLTSILSSKHPGLDSSFLRFLSRF